MRKPSIRKFDCLGRVWRFVWKRHLRSPEGEARWGECDDPATKDRAIYVDPRLEGKKLLEIILHEFFHTADFRYDETVVKQLAIDASELLWRAGYRRRGEQQ